MRKRMRAAAGGEAPSIPRRLHQTWKDAEPPRVLFSPRWSRSLREHNAGWEYRLWTDADNRALVAARYPWLLPTYDGYASPIQRADVARYAIAHAREEVAPDDADSDDADSDAADGDAADGDARFSARAPVEADAPDAPAAAPPGASASALAPLSSAGE